MFPLQFRRGDLFLFTHLTVERCPLLFIYLERTLVLVSFFVLAAGIPKKYVI